MQSLFTQHRRDFLRWLVAAPALAGCAVKTAEDERAAEAPREDGDGVAPPEVATSEEAATSCKATSRDLEGPYFEAGAPRRSVLLASSNEPGVKLVMQGFLLGGTCKKPLAGYVLDVWQADAEGNYHGREEDGFRLRGKIVTDAYGRYRFDTILPGHYGDAAGIRPAHIHVKVRTPLGHELLTTQLYFAGDPYLGDRDYCTRNRNCDSADPTRHLRLSDVLVQNRPAKLSRFDYVLPRT